MAKRRLKVYGERRRVIVNDRTVVVRGIFQQRKGDSYHVRVLTGRVPRDAADTRVLWRDDFYLENYRSEGEALRDALKHGSDAARRMPKRKGTNRGGTKSEQAQLAAAIRRAK